MTGSALASTVVPATADAVFGMLTDIARLPERHGAMTSVIDQPEIPASRTALAAVVDTTNTQPADG